MATSQKVWGLAILALAAVANACPGQDQPAPKATTHMVAMGDGVKLATDVYLPGDGTGRYPVIVARTPYDKSKGGRGSGGERRRDAGTRSWSRTCAAGSSRRGTPPSSSATTGWASTRTAATRWSGSPSSPGATARSAAGAAPPWASRRTWRPPARPTNSRPSSSRWRSPTTTARPPTRAARSARSSSSAGCGATASIEKNLETFVAHPRYDDFWKKLNSEAQAGKVRAPAVYHGGWYDIFLQGTINSFMAVHYHGGEGARGKCRLVIGPIGHGTFTELKYPANAAKGPACGDAFAWFDHVLLGKDNAVAKEKAVHYYVMGDPTDPKAPGNYWRHADDWPPPSKPTAVLLPSGRHARPRKAARGRRRKTYTYDPKDPVPNIGGQELGVPLGPMDQRKVEKRPDVLLFTTDELKEPIEVTGRITAKLFVSSDCPDTDFTVKLCDVYPDGRSMLVTDGILRARYHKSFEKESLLEPGRVYELNVDLWSTSLVFNTGHRIRIAVSSSNSPRFEANPNTGRAFRADKETRVAKNTVHLSAKHPSHIVLPVYEATNDR